MLSSPIEFPGQADGQRARQKERGGESRIGSGGRARLDRFFYRDFELDRRALEVLLRSADMIDKEADLNQ